MDANEPGLFDLPDREPQVLYERPQRGRNRETWALTATAGVTIIDAAAIHEAAARMGEHAAVMVLRADPDVENVEREGPQVKPANDAFDALGWLIWPTEGLEGLLEAGAFRILSAHSEVVAESVDRGKVTCTVTVKLTDVDQLRRLAAHAYPDEAWLIADSLAVAWQRAADPFAPIRSIPGIGWRPGKIDVEHRPVRTAAETR
jgi:hypothetical protein